jgi:NADPH:quinone reductase
MLGCQPDKHAINIPGIEFSGQIVETATDTVRFCVGDRVMGICDGAAQSEYLAVNEELCMRIPANTSWVDASAIPEAFVVAHDALITQARIRAGEEVFINAVGSSVGLASLQTATITGATCVGRREPQPSLKHAKTLD